MRRWIGPAARRHAFGCVTHTTDPFDTRPEFATSIRGPPPTDTATALSRRGTHLIHVLAARPPPAVGSTDPRALVVGMPEADSAPCGGLAPKEVCGLLAVGHQYPDALGGTLVGR